MKEKRPLNTFLFKNYLVISGLLAGVLLLALLITDFILDAVVFNGLKLEEINIEDIYAYPIETIDTDVLDTYGGWFEVLDENLQVIFVKGDKQDGIYQYTNQMLFQKMNLLENNENIIYHAYEVSGPNQSHYIFLWKQPLNLTNYSVKLLVTFIIVFTILLFTALYFYSLFSVRQIKRPLSNIIRGIKEMEKDNYKVRLNFNAEKEIAEIRDAFNKMAAKIEDSDTEKQRIEEAKKRMLLHLSHDLKTPITSIYGFSKLLYEENIKVDNQRKYLKYIHDKSVYLNELIHDLFELAHLDEKAVVLRKQAINVTDWLRQIMIEMYTDIEDKGMNLEINIPEEIIDLHVDAMKMKRVMTNILNNSIKHNDSGITIRVECKKDHDKVIIKISDNGAGIDEAIKDNLFDDFIMGHENTKDSSGLGLAISKKIVNLHNGSIILEEDEEKHTTFKITLPLYEENLKM
ncbi:signal transduction histidine kinase [Metabacillus malikii]|uniref:histidine kinase n=1 Tax=Metabacillus malikii TaxID=1504265 RepID=A0ABT9ZE89_9BACI|nr:signal transduction histidine kinase [Metabacillus malikii]